MDFEPTIITASLDLIGDILTLRDIWQILWPVALTVFKVLWIRD